MTSLDATVTGARGVTLDLQWRGILEPSIGRLYDDLSDTVIREYNDFIGRVSSPFMESLDWWVEAPASRNQLLTRLFHVCTCIRLVEALVNRNIAVNTILVDKRVDRIVFENLLASLDATARVVVSRPAWRRAVKWLRERVSPARSIVRILIEVYSVKFLSRRSGTTGDNPLILVDTFVIPGFVEEDRYYPGLMEYVKANKKHNVRLVPQFMNFRIREFFATVRRLRERPQAYVFKENFLTFQDILWCALHWIRIRKLTFSDDCTFGAHANLRKVVVDELRSAIGFRCALRGLINYRFAAGLRRANVKIAKTIDWFENHPMDRGWNCGFRQFYPDAIATGYQGFHATFLAARPIAHEQQAGVLPETVAVMGKAFEAELRDVLPGISLSVAPAFRYAWLWEKQRPKEASARKSAVLVALPYDKGAAEYILHLLPMIESSEPVTYLIKAHPGAPVELENTGPRGECEVRKIDGPLANWYQQACVVVTGGITTAGLEAMAVGVPAIHVTRPGRRFEIRIPKQVPVECFAICDDCASLQVALHKFLSRSDKERGRDYERAEKLRQEFFEPVTDSGIASFLSVT